MRGHGDREVDYVMVTMLSQEISYYYRSIYLMLMSLLRFSIVHHNEKSYVTVSRDKERDMTIMRIVTSHLVITGQCDGRNTGNAWNVERTDLSEKEV